METGKNDTEGAAIAGEEEAVTQPQTLLVTPTVQEQPLASAARTKHNDLEKNILEVEKLLHKAENPWRPSHRLKMKTEDVNKNARSILNKLTPQKFQTLVMQMVSLKIDSESTLKSVVYLVYEYAISEPNFSVAYANMCRCLSMFKVPSESKQGEFVNFRAILLTRCQREFEKDKSSEQLFVEKREEIEKADESKREELKAELEYEESKAKRRSLGNIRFIGELFKLKMLTENIMHDCVFKLLRTKDPENLECLCRLLTIIGKELETDKAKPRMGQYFVQMTKIVNEKKTSSRVRFMLQDVIDLRKNKWIPRRSDNNPKTIDQNHQEVAKEAQDRAFQAQQALAQQKATQKQVGGRRGPPGGPMGPPGPEGWNMVGAQTRTPFKTPIDRSIDPSKMKISKQQVDESIQLGPGGGASRFAGWGRGARTSQEKEKPTGPPNRFSALSKSEEEGRRGYASVSPASGEGRGRGGFGPPPRMAARASQEQEREKAIAAVKSMGISQSAEVPRERSRGREQEKERPSPTPATVPELSKEEIDKKTKAILDEYLHIQDMREAVTCVKELPPANHAHFCANALNHVLERSEVSRRQTGHLLHDLVKDSIISVDSYIKGLSEVLEFAEDMEIDIPKFWTYLGELVGLMIHDGSVPLVSLKEAAKPLVASNKAGIFVAEVLHDASHREKIAHSLRLKRTMETGKNDTEGAAIAGEEEAVTQPQTLLVTPTVQEQPLASAARTKHNDLEKNILEVEKLLHKAENPWRPSHRLKMKTEDVNKNARSILNKLTPQKFQTLVMQMVSLKIDSESTLKSVVYLVYEYAISEPNFSVAYANMCRCLSMFKVPSESKQGEFVNFRAILLTRCQREFEKDKSSEQLFVEKREEIEKADESKREELKAELEYEESKAKRRSLGNIRFIGELFKLKMLTENIMHDCVFKLLRTKDPENLECLCRLLTIIGKELETDKAKPRMGQYFVQMTKIVNEKKTSSRVRFMLQDVIDLRKNKWIPRRSDNNPKTIDQNHQEVAKEAQDRAFQAQQALAQQKATQKQVGGRRGPPGGPMGPPGPEGWNMVGAQTRTPFKTPIDRSIDPSKMKISKQQVDESIQLGPGGGASRFAGWGRGARTSQEKEKPTGPPNRFSALSKSEEEGRRGYASVSPARGEGRGRGGFGPPPRMAARASQEQEREKAIAAVKSMGISQSAEVPRERSRGREQEKERPSPTPATVPELSKEEIDKKTKAILDEYLHIQDMREAVTCVKELPPANHAHFCANALNHVLERSEVSRRQTGHLLHDLVKDSIISVDSYIKGLSEVLEFAEDMEIDIPKFWTYLGELVGLMIHDGSVPLVSLKEAAKPLVASNKAGIFVAEVLHDASHREGHKKVAELWQSSSLQWTDFLPKNQVDQFLIDKKLEFTKGGDSAPTTPTTGLPMSAIEEELHRLIVVEKRDNESVFDWIESNVDDPTTKRSKFIRALMTCVCNGAFVGDGSNIRVEPKEVSKRHDLLQKYLDHQPESELQALYALQALVTQLEHPPGVLRQMFDTLYDEDIISEDAFLQWEKSDEEPGKGVAMKQVVQFFTWLRAAEDDNDS